MEQQPGFRFKDGKLYAFLENGVMVLQGWPVFKAVRKIEEGRWQPFEPQFRVVKPYRPKKTKAKEEEPQMELGFAPVPTRLPIAEQRRVAFNGFRFAMPKAVAAAVEKFYSQQWGLLRLIQHSEGVIELARLNPAMAFALGNFSSFHPGNAKLCYAVEVSTKKRREIAEALGFPGTESAVKILAKILPESVGVAVLRQLRETLGWEAVGKTLSHMPRLNLGVLALVLNPLLREATTPALLEEVAAIPTEKYHPQVAEMLNDTLGMIRALRDREGTPRVQSLARLQALHAEVSAKFLAVNQGRLASIQLPAPPLPGNPYIQPLRTVAALMEEGKTQDNCVATYAEQVRRRKTYIYRVLQPERATLSIVKGADGDWHIGELQARSNTTVMDSTREAVQALLDEFALSV